MSGKSQFGVGVLAFALLPGITSIGAPAAKATARFSQAGIGSMVATATSFRESA
jgi:hypothetical protein